MSNFLREALTDKLGLWEDRGWRDVPNAVHLRALVNRLRTRCAITTMRVRSPTTDKETLKSAKRAIRIAANLGTIRRADPQIDARFLLSGARLSTLSQALAHKSINAMNIKPQRQRTINILDSVQHHFATALKTAVTHKDIWRSIRHRDIRLQITDFLWKITHGAMRCGEYWANIPGYEERAYCSWCGELESMEHILLECTASGQEVIWVLAEETWTLKGQPWSTPCIAEIIGVGLRAWKKAGPSKDEDKEASRLWKILLSESLYLIWKLRCERVIGHADEEGWTHSDRSVSRKWAHAMNARISQDRAMTHARFGRTALKRDQVLGTWKGTLKDEQHLPSDWTRSRVLVGIAPGAFDPG
ncbi:uncharacterized protein B0H18DRAFT_891836 [Fomitopsis serialis]|uniref:uncharacterized protein n=1 Tax=Fomitopsis serialis TaxID=139415 RepID=UPI0020087622|nr:uncharacterized protein B0H18DRAFT_891836 [Neoantrodia serialis]KAH9911757.1 hypothetical protein B0H18DRAFT_891836 [Neoantrodia serialis]